jgi:hypothetical protein
MWERLRRFRELGAPARGNFFRAAALLPWVAWKLKRQGFEAARKSLLQGPAKESKPLREDESARRAALTARMVRAAARHGIGNPSCLEESLVLLHLLARQGIASQLRIGVKKNVAKFEAHAWVECNGAALNETEALHDHYAQFEAEFSAPPRAEP